MSNPYQPVSNSSGYGQPTTPPDDIRGPAIGLMVVSILAIAIGSFGLIGNLFMYFSGAMDLLDDVRQRPIPASTSIVIKVAWGAVLILASSYVLYGSIQMKNLGSYSAALSAAYISAIPCIGPCCIFGIPFGIWAIVVLKKPGVRESFKS